jgi:membrane protease YdiL (CAAX protease family)
MSRIAGLGRYTRLAWTVSLVAANIAFEFAHSNRGVTGIIDEGLMGVLLGAIYLAAKGDLFIPIFAHGFQDTVDLGLLFLGKYPRM